MSEIIPIKCGNVNCFIISDESDNSAVLVDTGRAACKEKVLEKCRAYNIKLIVLTHGHSDHCQNASYLSDKLGVPIAINKRDLDLIPDNTKQPLYARTISGKLLRSISLQSFKKDSLREFKPELFLEDNMSLESFGISAKIISLPGHTNGSVGILADNDKLLAGDALMNMFYPTVSMIYTDEKEMRESAKKISELGDITIYFGHGKAVRNRAWVKK